MHVLLDLYGVVLDHEKMFRGYRDRLGEILSERFGGDADAWRRAHDDAFVAYVQRVNEADWDARGWAEIVDELDTRQLVEMFDRAGVAASPKDPLALSRELEREAMSHVNARYPDARPAIERLTTAGHKVYVATGGGDTNEAALRGAGLWDLIDGIFTGHTQDSPKSRPRYWAGIPERLTSSRGHADVRPGDAPEPRGPPALGRGPRRVDARLSRKPISTARRLAGLYLYLEV